MGAHPPTGLDWRPQRPGVRGREGPAAGPARAAAGERKLMSYLPVCTFGNRLIVSVTGSVLIRKR